MVINYLLRCSDYINFYSFPSCKHEVIYMCVTINISNHALYMKVRIPTIIKGTEVHSSAIDFYSQFLLVLSCIS